MSSDEQRRNDTFVTFNKTMADVAGGSASPLQSRIAGPETPVTLFPPRHTKKVTFVDALAEETGDERATSSSAALSHAGTDRPPRPIGTDEWDTDSLWRPSNETTITPMEIRRRQTINGGMFQTQYDQHVYGGGFVRSGTFPGRRMCPTREGFAYAPPLFATTTAHRPVNNVTSPLFSPRRSFHQPRQRSFNGCGQTDYSVASGVCLVGGDEYDCDYVDMSSGNSLSRLEDLNVKMERLMNSVDDQKRRIDRLFETRRRTSNESTAESGENTYRSLADDLYSPTTVRKETNADPKSDLKKVKRKLFLSCFQ